MPSCSLWGLVAFAAKPNDAPPVDPLPVEFVSATEFSQLTAGVKNAPKRREAKAAGRQGWRARSRSRNSRPRSRTSRTSSPTARHRRAQAEPKQQAKAEPKPEPKPAEKPEAKPEPKPRKRPRSPSRRAQARCDRGRAEKRGGQEAADEAAEEGAAIQAGSDRRGTQEGRKQEAADQIRRAIRSRRCSTSASRSGSLATAETLNDAASLGAPNGNAGTIVAERARCVAGAAQPVLEPAGGRRRELEALRRAPRRVQARWLASAGTGRGRGFGVLARSGACRRAPSGR